MNKVLKSEEKGGGQALKTYDRFFLMEDEWSVIHVPYKPNGFGIFIIGDRLHSVDENTSFWMQHHGRKQLLSRLLNEGYTLFQSNLTGIHWGSEKAAVLSKLFIHAVLKRETLNQKVHLLTEGMGGLIGLALMESIPEQIRSAAMLNPCLDLQAHLHNEKSQKFYYKRLVKEISKAYEIDESEVPSFAYKSIEEWRTCLPVRIWHRMNGNAYPYQKHSKKYEELRKEIGCPIDLSLHAGDHFYRLQDKVIRFFNENEKLL
ncbi:lipase family protein [Metabacillus kandeliae]|uniref:hypothetical protein n=1 Tax=Metabacillus kandeliae TaxID=2900151 RepID=UPI0038CC0CD5